MDRKLDRDWAAPVRYPDPAVQVIDKSFQKYLLGSAALERIWTGGRWTEGPVWFGDLGHLIWSDIPNNRMMAWNERSGDVTTFRNPANYANGNTRDRQGRLISCEHGSRSVTRTEIDGTIATLADGFEGKRLNAPNDVVVTADGSIWFTDPGYGIHWHYEGHKAPFELPTRTYRITSDGDLHVAEEELEKPNGLAFSPNEDLLYIADTGASHKPGHPRAIHVFDVRDSQLSNCRLFYQFDQGGPDGFRVDTDGNLWCAVAWGGPEVDGVHVISPNGELIGAIYTPEGISNVVFGGEKRNRLFMTGSQSIYSIYVDAQGVPYN